MQPAHRTNKVGLLPYGTDRAGERVFLLHLPKAKNPDHQADLMWGLVRGTVRDLQGNDLRSLEALRATPPDQIEPPLSTVMQEAAEECGLLKGCYDTETMKDHGLLDYHSLNKPPYPIHFFSVPINPDDLETLKSRASDAEDLAFKSLAEIEKMAKEWLFKPGYVAIVRAIGEQIP